MGKHGKHGEESEEEKRARRLAKKEAKRAKEAEGLAGYSNEANPWNDPHLADAFVWGKKNEKARAAAALRACFFSPLLCSNTFSLPAGQGYRRLRW